MEDIGINLGSSPTGGWVQHKGLSAPARPLFLGEKQKPLMPPSPWEGGTGKRAWAIVWDVCGKYRLKTSQVVNAKKPITDAMCAARWEAIAKVAAALPMLTNREIADMFGTNIFVVKRALRGHGVNRAIVPMAPEEKTAARRASNLIFWTHKVKASPEKYAEYLRKRRTDRRIAVLKKGEPTYGTLAWNKQTALLKRLRDDGWSYEHIAEFIGIERSMVRQRLMRFLDPEGWEKMRAAKNRANYEGQKRRRADPEYRERENARQRERERALRALGATQ